MQTNPIATMSPTSAESSTSTNKSGIMGKDDFLKILMAQMSHMDPMSPDNQDPTQSIAQMAQFSIIEQLTNLTQANEKSSGMAMLGKTATYKDPNGGTKEGVVTSIDTSGSDPTLTIGDVSGIQLSAVTGVR